MIAATWLNSGWVDAALIAGWMLLVVAIGVRVWRGSEGAAPGGRSGLDRPGDRRGPRVLGWLLLLFMIGPRLGRRSGGE